MSLSSRSERGGFLSVVVSVVESIFAPFSAIVAKTNTKRKIPKTLEK